MKRESLILGVLLVIAVAVTSTDTAFAQTANSTSSDVITYLLPTSMLSAIVVTWLIVRNRNAQHEHDMQVSNNNVRNNILLDQEIRASERNSEIDAIESTHRASGTAGLRELRLSSVAQNQTLAGINLIEEGANVARQSDHTMGSTLRDGVLAKANKV